MNLRSNKTMETVSEEVPEVIHEEAMATRVEQQPSSEMTLNAGNGNGFEALPSQNGSFTISTSVPSTSAIVITISPDDLATREIDRLNLQLTAAMQRIAEQDATISKLSEQLGRKEARELVTKQSHCDLEEFVKLMEQRTGQWDEEEYKKLFYYAMKVARNECGLQHISFETDAEGNDKEIEALWKLVNFPSSKAATAAPPEQTTAITITTTNEEGGVVPPSQPINDGDAVENVKMLPGNVQVLPGVIVDGNGDASRGDASSLSPLPADPSQALVSNDDDDEMGEESPKPANCARGKDDSHGCERSPGKRTKRGRVAGSRIHKQKKNSVDVQVSSGSSDEYTCTRGNKYARMVGLAKEAK